MIVQELHKLQHQHGYLPAEQLRRLAQRISVPLHRLNEVASFFPHFCTAEPARVHVCVCRDMACHLHGAVRTRQELESLAGEMGGGQVEVEGVSCLGQCDRAPAVVINDRVFGGKSVEELKMLVGLAAAGEPLDAPPPDRRPLGWQIDPYDGSPRYDHVRRWVEQWTADRDTDVRAKRARHGDPLLEQLKAADLRGMGGAGFPTARKWSTVRDAPGDVKYVVCNGDESEPGTFKDRELLRRTPHLLIEGMVLAGLVTGAQRGYVYIRHEYSDEIAIVRGAIAEAEREGICGNDVLQSGLSFPLEVFVSPGGYICGEESALLEAMEDRRAEPRNKPPFPVHEGLYGKPTVINNVETLCWVPSILTHGGRWYPEQGAHAATGLRFVSISGNVARPGVYEVPFGQTVGELVFETAGGVPHGRRLKAIAPSGPSGGFLPAVLSLKDAPKAFGEGLVQRKVVTPSQTELDIRNLPLDWGLMRPFPDFMLGAAFVVYDDRANMVEQALNCVEFYRNESCGKCVPCRLGTQKLTDIIHQILTGRFEQDLSLIEEVAEAMLIASICGLGQVAVNPIRSVLKYFRADLEPYLRAAGEKPGMME